MKHFLVFWILFFASLYLPAQDITYARSMIDSLCSPAFKGRGYVEGGDRKAAEFLQRQLVGLGVEPVGGSYFQSYTININSFPGEMRLAIDNKTLVPGRDYITSSSSPSISGNYSLLFLESDDLDDPSRLAKFKKKKLQQTILIIDTTIQGFDEPHLFTAAGWILATKTLPAFDVSEGLQLTPFPVIYVPREKVSPDMKKAEIVIENQYLRPHKTQNVLGTLPGTSISDTFIIFTAHYDHVGMMGKETMFPGAHDNASGCAMLLDLARHYTQSDHRSRYGMAFMFFSGEEAGLLGSAFYCEKPRIPLEMTKLVVNLDMLGSGSEGIKVVNGSTLPFYFDMLVGINKQYSLLKNVSPRGKARNSDHYWFDQKGVDALFIYTLGDEWKHYHDVDDRPEDLPLTEYEDLFRLLVYMVERIEE